MSSLFRILPVLTLCLFAIGASASGLHQELEDIAARLAFKVEGNNRKQVAVADFTDLQGAVNQLGRFVSEEISTNLVLAGKGFSVIDRNHLRTILKEQKLSMSGLMDPSNQKKLGRILGVDSLILGSITPFGESYRITFKVVATDTARVFAADRGSVPKTPATDELWDTIIDDMADDSAPSLAPTAAAGYSPGAPTIARMAKKGEFRNAFLSLVIESISLSKTKNRANVVARLTNVSKQDLYVAAHRNNSRDPGISMADNAGVTWVRAQELVGISTYPYDTRAFFEHQGKKGQYGIDTYLSAMTPGQSQPINISFKPLGDVGDPQIFSLSANLYIKMPVGKSGSRESEHQWRYENIGVGISGIKLK